jgi:tetratricopeptide (TPR) repeat protein
MKKAFLLIIVLFATIPLSAQTSTQKGYVKTRGKMVNGKLVPGTGLKGATVSVKGRTTILVQRDDGSFEFPIPSQTFRVESVKKTNYQLVDVGSLPKNYSYSSNPVYLLMETPEQQLQDKLDTERKIRRTLQKQLQQRESEIDAMQVSMAEKQKLLQKLYADQENNERLISDMAKRYSELDYDQLDDFYRQVNYCIENGDLTKADSLLRTRGDVRAQVSEQLQKGQVISMKEEELAKAKAVHAADNEELAKRCYSFYEEFLAQHQNDSAAYYLELRAKLDTTNIEWQNEAGRFIDDYLADYSKALNYYQLVLRQSLAQEGEESKWVATAYNNIGYVYHNQGDYPKALEYLSKALAILEKVLGTEHPDVATSYNNIGAAYDSQGDYPKALEYHFKALAIEEKVLGTDHPDVALSYNSIGSVYQSQGDYPKALEYYSKSIAIQEKVLGTDHPDVATSYNNIGTVYDDQGDYPKALEYHFKDLAILEKVLGTEHPNVATSYSNIGYVYDNQGDYPKALEYHSKALSIREKVLGTEHPDVATSYNNIGGVYDSQGDYPKALECYSKALAIREKVLGPNHPNTINIKQSILNTKYQMAIANKNARAFCEEHCFTATIVEGNTPAKQQGMSGEYVLLEFADWNQDSDTSLFDKSEELKGKPKNILVMKDGIISQHHFENVIGAQSGLKYVGREEKQRINKAYEEWKKKRKMNSQ